MHTSDPRRFRRQHGPAAVSGRPALFATLALTGGMFLWFATVSFGADAQAPDKDSRPIAEMLDAQGRLQAGDDFGGMIDPTGYELVSAQGEAPRFAKVGAAGVWTSLGSGVSNGVNRYVAALAVIGSDLYVGGDFTVAGGVPANHVARWNGSSWSSLGVGAENGVNDTVLALTVIGTDLYVGGKFTQAGSILANRVARWNGSTWNSLGAGVSAVGTSDPAVHSLAAIGGDLYVGGQFVYVGSSLVARNIARWDGVGWHTLGAGDDFNGAGGNVFALTPFGSDLFVGGQFMTVRGYFWVNNIARWNGSTWSALGVGSEFGANNTNGVNNRVNAITVFGGSLYVGGLFAQAFNQAGGFAANRVARWDGSSWNNLGVGADNGVNGQANALTALGNKLFVGGAFSQAGTVAANRVAQWDGVAWQNLGAGVGTAIGGEILAQDKVGSDLIVAGSFLEAGGQVTNYIAKWTPDELFANGFE